MIGISIYTGGLVSSINCHEPLTRAKHKHVNNGYRRGNLKIFEIAARDAGLIKCCQLCTDFNLSASTSNKVGYRVDGTVFVYSEATVCTYAMKMFNAYEIMLPHAPVSNHFTVTSNLLFYFRRTPVGI